MNGHFGKDILPCSEIYFLVCTSIRNSCVLERQCNVIDTMDHMILAYDVLDFDIKLRRDFLLDFVIVSSVTRNTSQIHKQIQKMIALYEEMKNDPINNFEFIARILFLDLNSILYNI